MMMFEFSSLVGIKFGFRHSQLTQQVRVCSGLRCKKTSEFWLRFKVVLIGSSFVSDSVLI
ncbi:hypothetical protein Hanom_Chr10g00910561 [Helianthus anomalus]